MGAFLWAIHFVLVRCKKLYIYLKLEKYELASYKRRVLPFIKYTKGIVNFSQWGIDQR